MQQKDFTERADRKIEDRKIEASWVSHPRQALTRANVWFPCFYL
jgi:hypothetical protein